MKFKISAPNKSIKGDIQLDGSKSISNRALILNALSDEEIHLTGLSSSDDTRVLQAALSSTNETIDIGAAGTSMRFLTAFLASQEGAQKVLTGSVRMKKRPIGVLVEALQKMGADIQYAANENCPPLNIQGRKLSGGKITMPASTSSQFISALLLIAPSLKNGIEIELEGKIVSRPYIQMTVDLLKEFGISADFKENILQVPSHKIKGGNFQVEADWSAASYYYSIAALSEEAEIRLFGLQEDSWQGDSKIQKIGEKIGVASSWQQDHLLLKKSNNPITNFDFDFLTCPDLAQTVVAAVAALNLQCHFTGLETLAHKETDRIQALKKELAKAEVLIEAKSDQCKTTGNFNDSKAISIETYEDHRMAMAFAPLALQLPGITIEDPMVVTKSYPNYYEDLKRLGFAIQEIID